MGAIMPMAHFFTAGALLAIAVQPYVNINVNVNYNNLMLPQPWGNAHFWLIGPRIDVTFTNKLFFTTFFQYNQQTE